MERSTTHAHPVLLVILDGWGLGRDEPGNAVLAAHTPVMDRLSTSYPHASLKTSGEAVGLPDGQMGNSEVGHLNLGAGFVVYQWITQIDRAIADGSFFHNEPLLAAIDRCRAGNSTLHAVGLVSDGGVHSHTRHLIALVRMARERGLDRVKIHAITDGRDTSPTSGKGFIAELERELAAIGVGTIATVSGRYYAMDRDKRWQRTELAYDAIVDGFGPSTTSAGDAIASSYADGVTDEFIVPTVIQSPAEAATTIKAGDEVVCFNFRSDRLRQLVKALALLDFAGFERNRSVADSCQITTMTRYEEGLPVHVAFEPHDIARPLARVVNEAGIRQFHCAETEKYAHVTFFFNGGREAPFPDEVRTLVPSPKVATYDLQPEMSAAGVTAAVIDAVESDTYGFIIVNYANGDMVGHTGILTAAVKAIETVDACLGQVIEATLTKGGVLLVTADHGNAEEMIDRETGGPMTAHTTNPVPVVLVTPDDHALRQATLHDGAVLCAVAPTILELLGVQPPADMTEPSLIANDR